MGNRAGRWTRGLWLGTLAGLLLTTGCAQLEVRPPVDARDALDRINANFERIDGALTASPAKVSARFHDTDGTVRRFLAYDATLIFAAPRCLYLDIKHPAIGSVARIGANDERYWLMIDVEGHRDLLWGTWNALLAGHARPLTVPANRLLDTLLLKPLTERLPRGLPPLLVNTGSQQELLFQKRDAYGWPYVARRLVLAKRAPYLPVEIIDYLPDGKTAMHAWLGRYARVRDAGANAPYTARSYKIDFNIEDASLSLDLLDVRYRTKDYPFCEFPDDWNGPSELLDEPPAAASAGNSLRQGPPTP